METVNTFFFHKALSAKVWCGLFCASWLMQFVMNIAAIYKPQIEIISYDGETVMVHTAHDFQDASELHIDMARLAIETLYLRGPNGPDNIERLTKIFLPSAYAKAMEDVQFHSRRFKEFGFQQKVTIAKIEIEEASDHFIRAHVSGQLIRTGHIAERSHSEADHFEASLIMRFNRNILNNQFYPLVVDDFDVVTQPTLSR